MSKIRPFEEKYWDRTWQIIEPVFRSGETYAISTEISEDEAHNVWIETPSSTYVTLGERKMQYNLVVSTNEGAIRLWKKHGFHVVGTLPKAFHHARLGYIDALVMYKQLQA